MEEEKRVCMVVVEGNDHFGRLKESMAHRLFSNGLLSSSSSGLRFICFFLGIYFLFVVGLRGGRKGKERKEKESGKRGGKGGKMKIFFVVEN